MRKPSNCTVTGTESNKPVSGRITGLTGDCRTLRCNSDSPSATPVNVR